MGAFQRQTDDDSKIQDDKKDTFVLQLSACMSPLLIDPNNYDC
jgi:hypothetical protein